MDGQILPVLGGLRVIETPGHTPGHISLYSASTGILFCGDSIVSGEAGLRGSSGANNWDQAKSDESVRKQAALGARILCSRAWSGCHGRGRQIPAAIAFLCKAYLGGRRSCCRFLIASVWK